MSLSSLTRTNGLVPRLLTTPTWLPQPTCVSPVVQTELCSPVNTLSATRLNRRWQGWDTTTVTVTATRDVPDVVTIWTTYGVTVPGDTQTQTVYAGTDTVYVNGPSYVTMTFYPTDTIHTRTTRTIPATTTTKTRGPTATASKDKAPVQTICRPGDGLQQQGSGLTPTQDQATTLYVIAIYIVGIAIAWNLVIIRDLLFPYKMLVVAWHEAGHALSCICLSIPIESVSLSPIEGGYLKPRTGDVLPVAALPGGYLFSIIIGGLLTFCGFNTLASKIASFLIGLCWIVVFAWQSGVAGYFLTACAAGLMVGLWWVDHAWGLRFYVLFVGVMSSFYVIWDTADDALFSKVNPCCSALWAAALGQPAYIFSLAWFMISFIIFVGFVLAALATFRQSPHAMYCQAQSFLPLLQGHSRANVPMTYYAQGWRTGLVA